MNKRLCTKQNPNSDQHDKNEPGHGWIHDSVHEIGEQKDGWPHGDIIMLKCENCGITLE